MISAEELDNLLQRISGKDMEALEKFYNELYKAVYGIAYILTKSSHDAEDIMQNTFIKVWEKACTYRPGTNARAWTLTIARNQALTKYKENKRFVELNFDIESEDVFAQTIHSEELRMLLQKLNQEEREIVLLYAEGFTHKEIAKIVKRPYATVRWKYRYALNKLTVKEKEENYERA